MAFRNKKGNTPPIPIPIKPYIFDTNICRRNLKSLFVIKKRMIYFSILYSLRTQNRTDDFRMIFFNQVITSPNMIKVLVCQQNIFWIQIQVLQQLFKLIRVFATRIHNQTIVIDFPVIK